VSRTVASLAALLLLAVACPLDRGGGSDDDDVVDDDDAAGSTGAVQLGDMIDPNDAFTLDSLALSGDDLTIPVSTSGGCAEHTWTLC
jgi:hypothetical protein